MSPCFAWFSVNTHGRRILARLAGKTSLTERLLFAAGVIDEIGSVDDGSTQTDSLALERQRGITIKAAVVSFVVGDVTVNLIDTPGHPDFIAEVERVLSVLDGAVLVISAVEGVQAQTRVLMRTLQRLRHPDADLRQQDRPRGARRSACCGDRRAPLTPAIVRWGRPAGSAPAAPVHAVRPGRRRRSRPGWPSCSPTTTTRCWPRTSTTRPAVPYRRLRRALAAQTGAGAGAPGVLRLGDHRGRGRRADRRHRDDAAGRRGRRRTAPVSGTVFKVERGPGRREGRLRPDVLGPAPRTGCGTGSRAKDKGHRDRGVRPGRGRPARRRSPPGRSAKLWGSATSGSATRSAGRRPPTASSTGSPRRPWRRSSCPAGRPTRARCTRRSPSSPSRTR